MRRRSKQNWKHQQKGVKSINIRVRKIALHTTPLIDAEWYTRHRNEAKPIFISRSIRRLSFIFRSSLFMIYWRCSCSCCSTDQHEKSIKKRKCSTRTNIRVLVLVPAVCRRMHVTAHIINFMHHQYLLFIIIRWSFLIAHTFEITHVQQDRFQNAGTNERCRIAVSVGTVSVMRLNEILGSFFVCVNASNGSITNP